MTVDETLRVLAVDDDPDVISFLELALSLDPSIEASFATCQAAALRYAELTVFDVLIVDVQLGPEDGINLARDLKQKAPALTIITLSASIDEEVRSRSAAVGAACVLDKPFDPMTLGELVRAAHRNDKPQY